MPYEELLEAFSRLDIVDLKVRVNNYTTTYDIIGKRGRRHVVLVPNIQEKEVAEFFVVAFEWVKNKKPL